jgi:hypothetical protein
VQNHNDQLYCYELDLYNTTLGATMSNDTLNLIIKGSYELSNKYQGTTRLQGAEQDT